MNLTVEGLSDDDIKKYREKESAVEEYLSALKKSSFDSAAMNTLTIAYTSSQITVKTLKAEKRIFEKFYFSPQEAFFGTTSSNLLNLTDYYPQSTIFYLSLAEFKTNCYKVDFPYPETDVKVIRTTLETDQQNIVAILEKPLQYLFDTGLQYNGTFRRILQNETNDTTTAANPSENSDQSELDKFMEQTQYMTCLTRDSNYTWNISCDQSVFLHPNGKVLIQCNCFNLSIPITMVNDTDFIFFENPDKTVVLPPPVYVNISKSAVLWIIISISFVWTIFILIGWRKDVKDQKKQQEKEKVIQYKQYNQQKKKERKAKATKKTNPSKQFQKVIINEVGEAKIVSLKNQQDFHTEEHQLNQLQQDSKKNSMILKFEDEEVKSMNIVKKKQNKKKKSKPIKNDDIVVQTEGLVVDTDRKGGDKQKLDHKKQKSEHYKQDEPEEECEEDAGGIEESQEADEDDESNEYEKEEAKFEKEEKEEKKHMEEEIKAIEKKNAPTSKQDEEEQEKKEEDLNKEEEIRLAKKPLPRVTCGMFWEVFSLNHSIYSIFKDYKKTLSRPLRFLINFCKIIQIFAMCSALANMLPLEFNIIAMLAGLGIAAAFENIATIMFKQKNTILKSCGFIVLGIMLGISIYLFISNMKELLPLIHEIWLWTAIYIFILEIFILEMIVILVKMLIQSTLQQHYEKKFANEGCNNLFVILWDIKMQRQMRIFDRRVKDELKDKLEVEQKKKEIS